MIAQQLDIDESTVKRHFKEELKAGRFEAVAAVGGKLVQKAMAGNMTAMIFYLKTQGRWSTRVEVTGAEGGPVQHVDLSAFLAGKTAEELAALEPFLQQLLSAAGGDGVDGDDPVGSHPDQERAG